jgi:excisionase family DNA binding protein
MPWLRIKPAAGYAGVSLRLLRQWLKEGLRHSRVGGAVLIRDSWIDAYIEGHEVQPCGADVDAIVDEVVEGLE